MSKKLLILKRSAGMRRFIEILNLVRKNGHFNLKVALFVEKRQNKFAHEFQKFKFVFN